MVRSMATGILSDAKHWLDRAEEFLALAENMKHEVAKAPLIRQAEEYKKMAERASKLSVLR